MKERDIQGKVVGYARSHGVIARKLDFGQGWPDVMFLYQGRIMFIEFKADAGRLRELQKIMIGNLEKHKFDVAVVRDIEHGMQLVDLLINH
jgi:hypothetical protein